MKFAIPVVLVAVLGLAGWIALSPAEVDRPRAKTPRATASTAKAPIESPEASTSNGKPSAKVRTPGPAKPRSYAKPAAKAAALAAARRQAMAARPPVAPPPRAEPVARKWGRMGQGGTMPSYPASAIKDGIRRYYGNLPKSGRIPARIEIEEVFAGDLVRMMNLPSTARIVEIGQHPTTNRKAFTEALALDPSIESTLGITALVDGERYREYIQLTE